MFVFKLGLRTLTQRTRFLAKIKLEHGMTQTAVKLENSRSGEKIV